MSYLSQFKCLPVPKELILIAPMLKVMIFFFQYASGAPILKQPASGYKQSGSYVVDFQKQEMGKGINFVIVRAGDEVHVRRVIQR